MKAGRETISRQGCRDRVMEVGLPVACVFNDTAAYCTKQKLSCEVFKLRWLKRHTKNRKREIESHAHVQNIHCAMLFFRICQCIYGNLPLDTYLSFRLEDPPVCLS